MKCYLQSKVLQIQNKDVVRMYEMLKHTVEKHGFDFEKWAEQLFKEDSQ